MRTTSFVVRVLVPVLLALGSTSCISPPDEHSYQLYPSPALPANEMVIVRLADAPVARFDGLSVSRRDWTEVRLRPGRHRIEWRDWRPDDWDGTGTTGATDFSTRVVAVLLAGHTYSLRANPVAQIVDETTARPVVAEPWPDP